MADDKPKKVKVQWDLLLSRFLLQLYLAFYKWGMYNIITLFLFLTPVLWAPQNWIYWWQSVVLFSESPTWIDVDPIVSEMHTGQCHTFSEKKDAVSSPITNVSSFYGPGTYLAWLLTAWVASSSSIWHSRLSQRYEETNLIDGDMLAALLYPFIAICDILYRLIRCRLDPGIHAAFFVVISATSIFGLARRLSWQVDGEGLSDSIFPAKTREWFWSCFQALAHSLILATIGEPYNDIVLVLTVYTLLLIITLYSEFCVGIYQDRYPYYTEKFRPRFERVAVFSLSYVTYLIVLAASHRPVFPRTGAKFTDLDQLGPLLGTVVTIIFFKRSVLASVLSHARRRLSGFSRLQQQENNEIELQHLSPPRSNAPANATPPRSNVSGAAASNAALGASILRSNAAFHHSPPRSNIAAKPSPPGSNASVNTPASGSNARAANASPPRSNAAATPPPPRSNAAAAANPSPAQSRTSKYRRREYLHGYNDQKERYGTQYSSNPS
ncbi:hypothetical protein BU16DRAFT_567042 [Lophium mytilinum]|uniref:Uncharacterized protein n=1 Tax=Lophium mytilinum TaxID=390894 RepID=A0A6A6QCY8_9PEZI|nr:hypothetical protein BU16DRAFT_567042 [Lophium mytilinum]